MMVISVCVNVLVLYMLIYKTCLRLALVHHVTLSSSSPAFGVYQSISKLQNRLEGQLIMVLYCKSKLS